MRLLACNGDQFSFTKDHIGDEDAIPPYAILSHTWQTDQEITYSDVINRAEKHKTGWDKIVFCAQQAKRDGLQYIWVDTCCINKAEHVELQDAINSMFRWYQGAKQCYVYLWDVSMGDDGSDRDWEVRFRESRWFERGWTLQELLAPRNVDFFSREGKHLGNKRTLERQIHEITGISIHALRNQPLSEFDVSERLSWIKDRKTTRKEDRVYSLLGIFGIFLVPNYGEGEEYAMKRFKRELDEVEKDQLRQQVSCRGGEVAADITMNLEEGKQAQWLVPFPRARCFAGRETQLAQLRAHIISEPNQRLAIYGLGGCGKTALALECAYWTRKRTPMRAVFWVPAINRESFEQAYYEIAMLLCIPGIEDDKADIKQLVKAQLSDESFGQWLLVVDNADDARVLFDKLEEGKSDDRLIDFLPQSRQGSIIFTTRTRVVATELAENHVIALSELDKAGATEVLTRRLPQERQSELGEGDTVDEFLEMLSFHALAIVQAIAFVNANEISLSEYIALYKNSERDAMDLLSTDFVDQTRYREATNAVATTWYISFERIQTQDAIAAEHLFFMACTAHNDIDPAMFPQHYTPVQHVKAMGTLKAYSFVVERQPRAEGPYKRTRKPYKTFDVHPLIHVAISGWLKTHHQWIVWIEKVLARLISIIPYGNPSTKEYWGVCMHHAIHAANLSEAKELEGGMILLERIAKCLRSQGHNQSAERTYRQALEQRQKMSGKEHPDTLMTMGNVALTLQSQRRWTEAEIILQEVLILTKKVLGERHPQTITTIGNQSLLLLAQRKYVEAEEAFRESFLISKEVYGAKHQETLTSMGNLGTALLGQKKYPEAESLLRETLVLRKEVLGTPHLDIFSNMSTLGTTLINQHKYVEAESLHREELALRTEMLGLEHPGTIASMHGLGGALCGQHKFAETEQLQRDALALSRKVSGEEDPATLANMSAIAHTLSTQKKYADAEHMHRVTLALKEKVLGLQHPDTLTSVYWLATLKQQQLMYRDALPLHERAYAGFVEVLGKEHATTMECKGEYDWVTHMVGVERLEEEGRAGRETGRVIGSEDTTESREVWVVRVRNRWRVKMKKFGTKQA